MDYNKEAKRRIYNCMLFLLFVSLSKIFSLSLCLKKLYVVSTYFTTIFFP